MLFTYQTRIPVSDVMQEEFLHDMAILLNKVEHKLFADYNRGIRISSKKSEYLINYGISARQFNAIRINLEGKIASVLALQDTYIQDLSFKRLQRKEKIKKLERLKNKTKNVLLSLYNAKQSLNNLTQKIQILKQDKQDKKARICFGSKKLFKKQFNLEKNDYKSHQEWLIDWQKARANQFYLIGSKDETMGNQSCITTINPDNTVNFKVKVPLSLQTKYGNSVTFNNVKINYGHSEIFAALLENIKRNNLQKKQGKTIHGNLYQQHGQALNFKFLCDQKGWRVFITVDKREQEKCSIKDVGAIGVDINYDHLALAETNNTGNVVSTKKIPLNTYGKSQEQAKAIIGDAVKIVVALATQKNKPIVIEDLNFIDKKRNISVNNKKMARMLSSFSYSTIKRSLQSRAFRCGIEIFTVNPAYSSVIGRVKFASIYNISVHQAAALVIARRYYGFSEDLPRCYDNIPDNTGGRITLPQLAKIAGKHIWSSWAMVQKKLKAALAVQYQMFRQAKVSAGLTRQILIEDIPF